MRFCNVSPDTEYPAIRHVLPIRRNEPEVTSMNRMIIIAILVGGVLSGCDLFKSETQEEPFGEVTATLNGADWHAFPRATVVYTEEVYVPQNDSMLSMQFDAVSITGFRTGALVLTFPYRGPGEYVIDFDSVKIDPDSSDARPDTLASIVSFYDTQHNVINAHLVLEEDDSFRVNINEVNRALGYIRGRFDGTLVYHEGHHAGSPTRNYPDTLRFVDGVFESEVGFVSATEND